MPLTVLVVDDHEGFRGSVRQLLERSEHCLEVQEAQSAEECLTLIQQKPPDLILMDIHLPDQNGLQATREILQICPRIAIFIITSLEVDEYTEEVKALGAWGIVSKCDLSGRELESMMMQVTSHV